MAQAVSLLQQDTTLGWTIGKHRQVNQYHTVLFLVVSGLIWLELTFKKQTAQINATILFLCAVLATSEQMNLRSNNLSFLSQVIYNIYIIDGSNSLLSSIQSSDSSANLSEDFHFIKTFYSLFYCCKVNIVKFYAKIEIHF